MAKYMKANIIFNKFYEGDGHFCGIEYTECIFKNLEQLDRIMAEVAAKNLREHHLVYEGYVGSIESL